MREKTWAHRRMVDDIPEERKQERLAELIKESLRGQKELADEQVGNVHLVLMDKIQEKRKQFSGRSDTFKSVHFPMGDLDLAIGDYCEVLITKSTGKSLVGEFLGRSSIKEFSKKSRGQPFYKSN